MTAKNNQTRSMIDEALQPLREGEGCSALYQELLQEIKTTAVHFQTVQNTYTEAFRRIRDLQKQLKALKTEWKV